MWQRLKGVCVRAHQCGVNQVVICGNTVIYRVKQTCTLSGFQAGYPGFSLRTERNG
jgi:hypothetical protein